MIGLNIGDTIFSSILLLSPLFFESNRVNLIWAAGCLVTHELPSALRVENLIYETSMFFLMNCLILHFISCSFKKVKAIYPVEAV